MAPNFLDRLIDGGNSLRHAFNTLSDRQRFQPQVNIGASTGVQPTRNRYTGFGGERTIIQSIYTRMSIDAAAIPLLHVRLDDDDRFKEPIRSTLMDALMLEANIDQGARHFQQDVIHTLLEKGNIAIVPTQTTGPPGILGTFEVVEMRVGEILDWYPKHVRVRVYNDETGQLEELVLSKRFVAVVENPFYAVMNEPNGTLNRLVRKLSLLDTVDEASNSGRLDLIVQLPFAIKGETKQAAAELRRDQMETQLRNSKYGVAYMDGVEKITQLNRPAENSLPQQITYLTDQLYAELGLTREVINGTADEKTMLNYYNRTLEPLLTAVAQAMQRTFLTKTARTQGHAIRFYRDPFKLLSISDFGDLADKLTRNEIATTNDLRTAIGWKPINDPKADELVNPNMPQQLAIGAGSTDPNAPPTPPSTSPPDTSEQDALVEETLAGVEAEIDALLAGGE